ncbi:MAG: cupin domain-containing protein, partial [Bacteroidales bacterium]|nr:cupin domain-containing protein [Bacteroidales bacterium]
MKKIIFYCLFLALPFMLLTQCSPKTGWQKKNDELIRQYELTSRKLNVPKTKIISNLEPGTVINLNTTADVALYPEVNAKLYWGTGTMTGILQLEPNAHIPEEILPADRFLFVLEGEVSQLVEGSNVKMIAVKREEQDGTHNITPRIDFIYLEKGSNNALTAGPAGAKVIEIYSPVRLDYLQKAGINDVPAKNVDLRTHATPNVKPNKVYDLYEFQLTELTEGAHSRLITGKNAQISFISMEPGSFFKHHIHPEEQTMLVLRGGCDEILLDGEQAMAKDDVVLIPGNMVHGAIVGEFGCDAIDIFWP